MYYDLKLKKPFGLHGLYTNISASRVDHHPKKNQLIMADFGLLLLLS